MLDRVQVTRPERRVINRAAQISQARIVGTGSVDAPTQSVPAEPTTEAATDGDGNVYTKHMFMLGIDPLGGIGGHLSVKGKVIDYGD